MTASVATATVRIEPDLTELATRLRSAVADELRRIADELMGLDSTSEPEEPKPPRYILVRDRSNDYGILDTELDIHADYGDCNPSTTVRPVIERLNAGTLDRRDIDHGWVTAEGHRWGPFTPVADL